MNMKNIKNKKNIIIVLSTMLLLFPTNMLSQANQDNQNINNINIYNDSDNKNIDNQEILIVDLKINENKIHFTNISIKKDSVSVIINNSELKNYNNKNNIISLTINNSKFFLYNCKKYSDTQTKLYFSNNIDENKNIPCQKIEELINGLNGVLTNSNNEQIDVLSVSCSIPHSYKKYTLEIEYNEENISKILNSNNLKFTIGDEVYRLAPAYSSNNICLYSKRFEIPDKISSEESIFLEFINNSDFAIKPTNNLCNLAFSIISKLPIELQKKYVNLITNNYNSNKSESIAYDELGISHTTSQKNLPNSTQFSDNYTISISISKDSIPNIDINSSSICIAGINFSLISYIDDEDKLILNYYKDIPYNSQIKLF